MGNRNQKSSRQARTAACVLSSPVRPLKDAAGRPSRGRQRHTASQTFVVEAMENRTLLSAVTWTGAGDHTNWTDPNNWSTGSVPGPADDVTIDVAGNITVNIPTGTQSIRSVTTSDTIAINGGTLAPSDASQAAHLKLTAGDLGGAGAFTITGSLDWNQGMMDGTGKTVLAAGATGTLGRALLGRELDNAGAITLTDQLGNVAAPAWIIHNLAGGTFTTSSGAIFFYNQMPLGTPVQSTFDN